MKTELFAFAQAIASYNDATNLEQQLFNVVYNHRIDLKSNDRITGFNNVAATALVFNDKTMIIGIETSHKTRSKTSEDDRNNHAERESLAEAIYKAILQKKEPFDNELFNSISRKEIKNLLSLNNLQNYRLLEEKDQLKQTALFKALGSLSTVATYSEREFCNFQNPGNEGCRTYLDTLESKCGKTGEWLGYYSIPKDIRSECSKELLDHVVSKEIQSLTFSTNYGPSDKEILCKAIFSEINKSISEINQIYSRFGRVESRGVIPLAEVQQINALRMQLIEQINAGLADPRKTIKSYKSTTASTSTVHTPTARLATLAEEFTALPSQQPKQDILESTTLKILEEIQSKIGDSIAEFDKDKIQANTLQVDKSLEKMKESPIIWNKKIQEVLQSLREKEKELNQQLPVINEESHQQILMNIKIITNQGKYLSNLCKNNLQLLNNDLQQLPKLTRQELLECRKVIYGKLIQLQQSITDNIHLFKPAVPASAEQIFPLSQGQDVSELLDRVAAQPSEPTSPKRSPRRTP